MTDDERRTIATAIALIETEVDDPVDLDDLEPALGLLRALVQ